MGATSVFPLPLHCRCGNWHYTTFDCEHYEDGWDLPEATRPLCGGSMEGDGHRLSSRSLAMRLPEISLRIPDEMRQLVVDYILDYWQCTGEDGTFAVEPYSDEEMTALQLSQPDGQQGIIGIGALCDMEPAPEDLPPKITASHCIKATGLRLAEGAWSETERTAIYRGEIDFLDVIAFREDVYGLIRQHTPPKQRAENGIPWEIMEAVRKGKYAHQGMPDEVKRYLSRTLHLPRHYINAMKRIEYLPKKGDCVARMIRAG